MLGVQASWALPACLLCAAGGKPGGKVPQSWMRMNTPLDCGDATP